MRTIKSSCFVWRQATNECKHIVFVSRTKFKYRVYPRFNVLCNVFDRLRIFSSKRRTYFSKIDVKDIRDVFGIFQCLVSFCLNLFNCCCSFSFAYKSLIILFGITGMFLKLCVKVICFLFYFYFIVKGVSHLFVFGPCLFVV